MRHNKQFYIDIIAIEGFREVLMASVPSKTIIFPLRN